MTTKNVFSQTPETAYVEPAIDCDFEEFKKVVESRRSVRDFTPEVIPDSLVEECLRLCLLAPNSSNLQPWEFIWVKTPDKLKLLQEYCLNQPAARSSSTLIVCVARPDLWARGQKINQDFYAGRPESPKSVLTYYSKLVPFVYSDGPFNILAPFKSLAMALIGIFRPIPRGPFGKHGSTLWATKTTALACENLMLAFRAAGFDTCPMEGFDEVRVKDLLDLPKRASVTMIISAGRRSARGVYAPRLRGAPETFIKRI